MGDRGNLRRRAPLGIELSSPTRQRVQQRATALVAGAIALLVAIACTPGSTSPRLSPSAAGSPGASSFASPTMSSNLPAASGPVEAVSLGDAVELAVGDRASITDTNVTFALLAATGPGAGCNDCPNQVRLAVGCPPDSEVLDFAFSGGMEESALERARQADACDVTFYVAEVHDGSATVQVDRPS